MAESDELLTVDEVAERVKVNPETVRRWIKSGRLSAARPAGGPYRIHSTDLDRLFGTPPKVEAPSSLKTSPEAASGEGRRTFELHGLMSARTRRGVSLDELSFHTGLSTSEISDLENLKELADRDTVDLLRTHLGDCYQAELIFEPEVFDAFLALTKSEEAPKNLAEAVDSKPTMRLAEALRTARAQRARKQLDAG